MVKKPALITHRDPQGRQATNLFEAAYDKCRLTREQAQQLNMRGGEFQAHIITGIREFSSELGLTYFTPVPDAAVPKKYQATCRKYRLWASEQGASVTTPVCYRVCAGFTLKTHAPKAGPCHENYQYLQDWNFTDEATTDCLVFWVPRIVEGSTSKTKDEQVGLLSSLRAKLELPAHHLGGFGKVALLAGLILAHYKATSERIPLNGYWARTDTCGAGGYRLGLGSFGGAGLGCGTWGFDGDAGGVLGVFALGVAALGN